jgi:hypothetical protein
VRGPPNGSRAHLEGLGCHPRYSPRASHPRVPSPVNLKLTGNGRRGTLDPHPATRANGCLGYASAAGCPCMASLSDPLPQFRAQGAMNFQPKVPGGTAPQLATFWYFCCELMPRSRTSSTRLERDVLIPVQAAHQNGMMPPAVTE